MVHVLMFLCHGKITLIFIVHLLWARLHSNGIRKMPKWTHQKQTLYCTSRKWKDETRSCCTWVGTKDWSINSSRSSWRNTVEVILNFKIWSRHSKRWSLKKNCLSQALSGLHSTTCTHIVSQNSNMPIWYAAYHMSALKFSQRLWPEVNMKFYLDQGN